MRGGGGVFLREGRVKFIAPHFAARPFFFFPRTWFGGRQRGGGAGAFGGGAGGAAENGRGEGSPEAPSLLIKAFRYSDLLPAW